MPMSVSNILYGYRKHDNADTYYLVTKKHTGRYRRSCDHSLCKNGSLLSGRSIL